MPLFGRSPYRRSRSTVLLVLILLTTGVLAWQAHYAVQSHRAAAESVLRDYAALAADELVRRTAAKIGYEGYYPLVTALADNVRAASELDEGVAAIRSSTDEKLAAALPLVRRFFAADPGRSVAFSAETEVPGELSHWLASALGGERGKNQPYLSLQGIVNGAPVAVVLRDGAPTVGFEVDLDALAPFIRGAFEDRPLLPPTLGRGEVPNAAVAVALSDHGGVERFRSAGVYDARFGAASVFEEEYGGVLQGSRVVASIDPASASALVIGGLPPSRLPLLAALLLLAAALMATVVVDLRRERVLQKLRGDFVASVSHELRTPLTQIRMFAETLLLGRVRSDAEARRSLEVINREVRRLSHLVDNVLQFSRAERDSVALSPESIELEPRVREVIGSFQPLVDGTGVRIETRFQPGVEASVDPDALRQVLLNLLDNAVKYGPRKQSVVVGVEPANGCARLFVEDEGPGIPPRERELVFERFYRLERERTSSVAGTGIGLAVVRDLVARQGGRAVVEAGASGGARIVIELPSPPVEEGALP
ncbi:MAG TPA: HAMP domain-containing sensor histidine kinase [Vicinamibacteria bacterium]|nr:HAMP domain-containing sensor histidine kinase [Vicinamibacteria bacterium]